MGTLIPARCWGSEVICLLARKGYFDEFRRQVVDLGIPCGPRWVAARDTFTVDEVRAELTRRRGGAA